MHRESVGVTTTETGCICIAAVDSITRICPRSSAQQVCDHVSVHIGKAAVYAVVVKSEAVVVEPQQMQNGRMKVRDGDLSFGHEVSDLIRNAVAMARLDACPSQKTGERRGMMIAAG